MSSQERIRQSRDEEQGGGPSGNNIKIEPIKVHVPLRNGYQSQSEFGEGSHVQMPVHIAVPEKSVSEHVPFKDRGNIDDAYAIQQKNNIPTSKAGSSKSGHSHHHRHSKSDKSGKIAPSEGTYVVNQQFPADSGTKSFSYSTFGTSLVPDSSSEKKSENSVPASTESRIRVRVHRNADGKKIILGPSKNKNRKIPYPNYDDVDPHYRYFEHPPIRNIDRYVDDLHQPQGKPLDSDDVKLLDLNVNHAIPYKHIGAVNTVQSKKSKLNDPNVFPDNFRVQIPANSRFIGNNYTTTMTHSTIESTTRDTSRDSFRTVVSRDIESSEISQKPELRIGSEIQHIDGSNLANPPVLERGIPDSLEYGFKYPATIVETTEDSYPAIEKFKERPQLFMPRKFRMHVAPFDDYNEEYFYQDQPNFLGAEFNTDSVNTYVFHPKQEPENVQYYAVPEASSSNRSRVYKERKSSKGTTISLYSESTVSYAQTMPSALPSTESSSAALSSGSRIPKRYLKEQEELRKNGMWIEAVPDDSPRGYKRVKHHRRHGDKKYVYYYIYDKEHPGCQIQVKKLRVKPAHPTEYIYEYVEEGPKLAKKRKVYTGKSSTINRGDQILDKSTNKKKPRLKPARMTEYVYEYYTDDEDNNEPGIAIRRAKTGNKLPPRLHYIDPQFVEEKKKKKKVKEETEEEEEEIIKKKTKIIYADTEVKPAKKKQLVKLVEVVEEEEEEEEEEEIIEYEEEVEEKVKKGPAQPRAKPKVVVQYDYSTTGEEEEEEHQFIYEYEDEDE